MSCSGAKPNEVQSKETWVNVVLVSVVVDKVVVSVMDV